jgi:hypothetical protein
MGISNFGMAYCRFCGAQFRLFTIFNRDMQGLCKVWKRRHERSCEKRTPADRKKWAKKYVGKDSTESSVIVDLTHEGFAE